MIQLAGLWKKGSKGDGGKEMVTQTKTALWKAIRAFCIQCMGNRVTQVELCTAPRCPLFPYRLGMNHLCYREGRKIPASHTVVIENRPKNLSVAKMQQYSKSAAPWMGGREWTICPAEGPTKMPSPHTVVMGNRSKKGDKGSPPTPL